MCSRIDLLKRWGLARTQKRLVPRTQPRAAALRDHFETGKPAHYSLVRDDGLRRWLDTRHDFEGSPRLARLDQTAREACRGRVLDVGAGSGRNSLALQQRGLEVTALDVSPICARLMRRRGVRDVRCLDVFALRQQPFDTALLLMHGIGLAGTLEGLAGLLEILRTQANPDGQVLLDSYDFRVGSIAPVQRRYRQRNRRENRYEGEMSARIEYGRLRGEPLRWIYVDRQTLADHATRAGWRCEILHQEPTGDYLARLSST